MNQATSQPSGLRKACATMTADRNRLAAELEAMTEERNREAGKALDLAMKNARLRAKIRRARWVTCGAILLLAVLAIAGWLT